MIKEVVVYRIKKTQLENFHRLRQTIASEVAGLSGFCSIQTHGHNEESGTFMDVCEWQSAADAKQAFEQFPKLPSAPAFMETFAGEPVYAGHFDAAL